MKRIFILVLILFICFIESKSDDKKIKFQRIDINSKLSQSTIHDIYQDRNGFLWVGTNHGLVCYFGNNIKTYQNIPFDTTSISDNIIISICEDRYGSLWIGTLNRGLNRFDKISGKFHNYRYDSKNANQISGNSVYALLIDSKGKLWIGTNHGLNIYDEKGDVFQNHINKANRGIDLRGGEIRCLYEDRNGNIWIGTTEGIYKFANGIGKPEIFIDKNNKNRFSNAKVQAIHEDRNGILWIGTTKGLYKVYEDKMKIVCYDKDQKHNKGLKSGNILSIFEDSENNIWIGTSFGLELYDRQKDSFIHFYTDLLNSETISDDCINCIVEDKSKNVWFGTWKGLNKYSILNEKFMLLRNSLKKPDLFKSNSIFSILMDSRETLWIGTDMSLNVFNFSRSNEGFLKSMNINFELKKNLTVRSLIEDSYKFIWIGTDKSGLIKYNPAGNIIKTYNYKVQNNNSISDNSISTIYEDKEKNIWIGTSSRGMNRYNRASDSFTRYTYNQNDIYSISGNKVRAILEDSRGLFWVGTNNGLDLFDRASNIFYPYKFNPNDSVSISNSVITSLCEDSLHNIWAGTLGGGLNKFDFKKKVFYHFTQKEGLVGNIVYGVLCDNMGNLWVSTDMGLSKIDPIMNKIRNYDESDGLQGNEFNTGSYFKSKSGELFFGGINGLNYFSPDKVIDNLNRPNVVITRIKKFDGKESSIDDIFNLKEFDLSYKDVYFTIEFSALDYTNPKKNQYAYKLEGLDNNWIECGNNNYAMFTKLSGGTYTFKVKASNNDGIWNEEGTTIKINVSLPPWERWWAQVGYALTFISVVTGIIIRKNRNRKKKIEEKNLVMKHTIQSMEKEREWIAQNLHDGVNQKILAVNNYIGKILINFTDSDENKNLLKVSSSTLLNAVREIRSISQKNYPVELRKFGLIAVIENAINDFQAQNETQVIFEHDNLKGYLTEEMGFNVYRIIQEAFNNIEKHSHASKVNLSLKIINNRLEIKIKDNGIGFDVTEKLNKSLHKKNFGLDTMEQRSMLFNGEYYIYSKPNEGTEIRIAIPIVN